jgi:putative DNA primase/helicase
VTAAPRSVTADSMLEAALAYAREGVPVFPLSGKIPFKNTHGHLDATTDESVIRRMWEEHPGANIGMPTGEKTGVFVVDPDGPKGAKTLAALEVEHGPLPETHEVRTGRSDGGRHLYFHQPVEIKIKSKDSLLGPKLDVKGDGGYVVVPPSIHPASKRPYTLVNDGIPAEPPAWLLDLVRETAAKQNQPTAHLTGSKIPYGQHDVFLARIAGKLRRDGLEEEAIKNALVEVCEKRCEDYGTDYKVMCTKIARSVCRYDPAAEEIPGRLLITEGSNADRLVERFRPEIRFASDRKIWCVWDGTHWAVNDVMGMSRRMQEVARRIYFEAANAPEELRKALGAWALKSESSYVQRGSIEEARNMVEVRAFSKTFDTHPRLLNVSNGTVNLETGEFRPHQREDFLTKIVDIEYRP